MTDEELIAEARVFVRDLERPANRENVENLVLELADRLEKLRAVALRAVKHYAHGTPGERLDQMECLEAALAGREGKGESDD